MPTPEDADELQPRLLGSPPNGGATTKEYLKWIVAGTQEALRVSYQARDGTTRLQHSILGDPGTDPTDIGRLGEVQRDLKAFIEETRVQERTLLKKRQISRTLAISIATLCVVAIGSIGGLIVSLVR
jgi:hypothetical protein